MDIYTSITEIASVYEDVNKQLASDPCATDSYQVFRQEQYRDACDKLQTADVEGLAIRLVADSVSDKVLVRLRGLIRENIRIYETRKDDFNGIGFDKLYTLWDEYLFAEKRALLLKDKETIKNYPYPIERERELLLQENRSEMNQLDNERSDFRRANASWVGKNYYVAIYELSCAHISIFDSYFPNKAEAYSTEVEPTDREDSSALVKEIAPDEIFRTRMFDRFRELEARLIKSGDLDNALHWVARHKNDKPDIKRLVTFLTGLLDNGYFLPNRDSAIKSFFELRYHISIGQNFERRRRELLLKEHKTVFYDYPF